jgi:hypothetical protein
MQQRSTTENDAPTKKWEMWCEGESRRNENALKKKGLRYGGAGCCMFVCVCWGPLTYRDDVLRRKQLQLAASTAMRREGEGEEKLSDAKDSSGTERSCWRDQRGVRRS